MIELGPVSLGVGVEEGGVRDKGAMAEPLPGRVAHGEDAGGQPWPWWGLLVPKIRLKISSPDNDTFA